MSDKPTSDAPDLTAALADVVLAETPRPDLTEALAGVVVEDQPKAQVAEALADAAIDEPPTAPEEALAALAATESAPAAADPVDEERLAQRREALAASTGRQRSTFTVTVCLLLAGLGLSQAYISLILSSGGLLACGLISLLLAYSFWLKTHWLQFNMRTALVAMVVVSLPFAWIGSQVRRYLNEEAAIAELSQHWQGKTVRTYEHLPGWFCDYCPADWLPVFGPVRKVEVHHAFFGDEQLPLLDAFSALDTLDLGNTQVSDAGVERLVQFSRLHSLSLENTLVTRETLVTLRLVPTLLQLKLIDTAITHEDAREFRKRFPRVRTATGKHHNYATRRPTVVGVRPAANGRGYVFEDLDPDIERELQDITMRAVLKAQGKDPDAEDPVPEIPTEALPPEGGDPEAPLEQP